MIRFLIRCSDIEPLCNRLLVQEVRNKDCHVPANILGVTPITDPDLRVIYRGPIWDQTHNDNPGYQYPRLRGRVRTREYGLYLTTLWAEGEDGDVRYLNGDKNGGGCDRIHM